jgi:diaminopimelate decarboxylase
MGAGAEVVSGGELRQALRVGFSPSKILFSGVGKTRDEIRFGVKRKILDFNVESFEELKALEKIAAQIRLRASVSVRINFPIKAKTHPHTVTSGELSKFGVYEKEALLMYEWARRSKWLKIAGLHCHLGSQVFSSKPYLQAAHLAKNFIRQLAMRKISLSFVDMGGGFGVGDEKIDFPGIVSAYLKEFKEWPAFGLILEPGRFLVAESGILLTRIVHVKAGGKRKFLIVDAGMNDFLRPALYGARHPVVSIARKTGKAEIFDVAGPVCESADFFARDLSLSAPKPGEFLGVLNAGAYGFSMSSQYNFRPRAAEVLVDGKTARLIRRRETFADLIRSEA